MLIVRTGWLTDLTQWLWDAIKQIWKSFVDFVDDLFLVFLEKTLSGILYVIDLLPMPEFLQGNSIGSFLGQAGPTIVWLADVFRVGPSLGVIGSAMVFYVLRRILTVGIW